MKKLISICLLLLTVFSMSSIGTMNVRAAEAHPYGISPEAFTPRITPDAAPPADKPNAGPYLHLETGSIEIPVYSTYQLVYDSSDDSKVTWTSDDPETVSVSSTGLVTALKVKSSSTTITGSIPDGSGGNIYQYCIVLTDFIDVMKRTDYFYGPVYWAIERGITTGLTDKNGKPTGYFKPNDKCTRGQIVTFLYRCFRIYSEFRPDTSGVADFKDVKSSSFYYDAVKWAVASGITTGYTDKNGKPTGKFGPDDVCTRAQVVTFIYRLIHEYWDIDTSEVPDFTDVKSGAYYYDAVKWCVAFGITTGYSNSDGSPSGKFGPDDKCTRGQVVTFLSRAEDWD